MNRRIATLTRMLAALTIVFASLVVMPVGDALACSPESSAVQMVASYDAPSDDTQQPAETSGLCTHGHCHHAASDQLNIAEVPAPFSHTLIDGVARERVHVTAAPKGLLRPPRI